MVSTTTAWLSTTPASGFSRGYLIVERETNISHAAYIPSGIKRSLRDIKSRLLLSHAELTGRNKTCGPVYFDTTLITDISENNPTDAQIHLKPPLFPIQHISKPSSPLPKI